MTETEELDLAKLREEDEHIQAIEEFRVQKIIALVWFMSILAICSTTYLVITKIYK